MKKRGRKKGSGKSYKGVYDFYFYHLKFSAAERDIPFNITLKHLGDLWEKQPVCPYSGESLIQKTFNKDSCATASLDRINPEKGYQPRNIQWVHKEFNKMKGVKTHEEFLKLIKIIEDNGIKKHFRKDKVRKRKR
jgi:hypothetical protein